MGNKSDKTKEVMKTEIKVMRAKIFNISKNLISYKESDDARKTEYIFELKFIGRDLDKQIENFVENYIQYIGTQDGFLKLIHVLTKLNRLDVKKPLKDFEEVEKRFRIVDEELKVCLRKHFGEIHLRLDEVEINGHVRSSDGAVGFGGIFLFKKENEPLFEIGLSTGYRFKQAVHLRHLSLLKKTSPDYIIKGECSVVVKEFHSKNIDLIIPPYSIKTRTVFWIKEYNNTFNYPFQNMKKLSAVYEVGPDSCVLENPVILKFKNIKVAHLSNICLFKQHLNDDDDKKLNLWTIYFPDGEDKQSVEFKLNSFSILFLNVFDFCFDINGLKSNQTSAAHSKDYQKIKPGLNFRINCKSEKCKDILIITDMGYGTLVCNDKLKEFCNYCTNCIERYSIDQIANIIFFQSEAEISYKLFESHEVKTKKVKAIGNRLVLIGKLDVPVLYSTITINVRSLKNMNESSDSREVVIDELNVRHPYWIPESGNKLIKYSLIEFI